MDNSGSTYSETSVNPGDRKPEVIKNPIDALWTRLLEHASTGGHDAQFNAVLFQLVEREQEHQHRLQLKEKNAQRMRICFLFVAVAMCLALGAYMEYRGDPAYAVALIPPLTSLTLALDGGRGALRTLMHFRKTNDSPADSQAKP